MRHLDSSKFVAQWRLTVEALEKARNQEERDYGQNLSDDEDEARPQSSAPSSISNFFGGFFSKSSEEKESRDKDRDRRQEEKEQQMKEAVKKKKMVSDVMYFANGSRQENKLEMTPQPMSCTEWRRRTSDTLMRSKYSYYSEINVIVLNLQVSQQEKKLNYFSTLTACMKCSEWCIYGVVKVARDIGCEDRKIKSVVTRVADCSA